MAVKSYRDLLAWQKAMDLVVNVYRITQSFPKEEIYSLTSQLRRSAVSVPSNVAEGQGRGLGNEFARHLRISIGSLQEMETQLLIAERLGYVDRQSLQPILTLADEVGRITRGLLQSVMSQVTSN